MMKSKVISLLILITVVSICQAFTASKETFFFEDFQNGEKSGWVPSSESKYQGSVVDFNAGISPVIDTDIGMVLMKEAKHYAITKKLAKPVDNSGKELIVQYEVQFQKGVDCAGAYLKLYTYKDGFDPASVDNNTPYSIMFGPDKCGENRVHFIVRHKNQITGEFEEKMITTPPAARIDTLSHLYTLHIRPDNSFTIYIDQDSVLQGNFHESFKPAFNPPKEINDPTDEKPADWVDVKEIADPEAVKPADWDDQPPTIADPEAIKPEDWNDEDDGTWEPPMLENPDFQGEWSTPMIPNPAYKGEWVQKKIANPEYYEVENPYIVEKIGAVGIEVWTMTPLIKFDNIIITHDKNEADQVAAETFSPKSKLEKERQAKLDEEKAAKMNAGKESDLISQAKNFLTLYIAELQNLNPLYIVSTVLAVLIPVLLLAKIGGSSAPKKSKDSVVIEKETTEKKEQEDEESSEEEEEEESSEEEKTPIKKRTNKVK